MVELGSPEGMAEVESTEPVVSEALVEEAGVAASQIPSQKAPTEPMAEKALKQEPKRKSGGGFPFRWILIAILIGVVVYLGVYYADQVKNDPTIVCTLGIPDNNNPLLCYSGGGAVEYEELGSKLHE